MDRIVVLKEGQVSEVGTYQELLDNDGAFAEFLRTYLTSEEEKNEEEEEDEEGKNIKRGVWEKFHHL